MTFFFGDRGISSNLNQKRLLFLYNLCAYKALVLAFLACMRLFLAMIISLERSKTAFSRFSLERLTTLN
jgi:hypothetical protein